MVDKTTADSLAKIAVKQIRAGVNDPKRKKRLEAIAMYEKAYAMENKDPDSPGEFSFVAPVIPGFIDTLTSKLNDPVKISFGKREEADLLKAKKTTALWELDSSPAAGKWRIKDIHGKKFAGLSGLAIFFVSAEGDRKYPKKYPYRSIFEWVDYKHFYCEPKKGNDLEEHRFNGRLNVWRTESELKKGAESGIYDKEQVEKLIASQGGKEQNEVEHLYSADKERYQSLGIEDESNYLGEKVFCLVNHYMENEGTRYYVFIDYYSGTWIRVEKLEDMYSKPDMHPKVLWPHVSWATHPDPRCFWSKAPADDVWVVHEGIRIILNLAFQNLKQRTKKKRAIDPSIFPDPSEIEDAITQTIEVNSLKGVQAIGNGVYEFQTEDNTRIVVNLVSFLSSFWGQQTGITPSAQGAADEKQATIYVGNIEQVASRMGLYSEFYKQCWAEIGLRYVIGIKDHLTEGQFVKMLGATGLEWAEMTVDDAHPIRDYDIIITGGESDMEASTLKKREKRESLILAIKEFKQFLNPLKASAELLRSGNWDEEDIKAFQDLDVYGDEELLSKAAQAIQDIIEGKDPKKVRSATEAFVMKIIDFADDNFEEDDARQKSAKKNPSAISEEQYQRLYSYAYIHLPLVARNMAKRAMMIDSMRSGNFGEEREGLFVPGRGGMPGQENGMGMGAGLPSGVAPAVPPVPATPGAPAAPVVPAPPTPAVLPPTPEVKAPETPPIDTEALKKEIVAELVPEISKAIQPEIGKAIQKEVGKLTEAIETALK